LGFGPFGRGTPVILVFYLICCVEEGLSLADFKGSLGLTELKCLILFLARTHF